MSLSKSVGGEDLIREDNIKPYKPTATYLLEPPEVGDFVSRPAAAPGNFEVEHTAADQATMGLVLSVNSDNGTLSIAELKDNVRTIHEYASPTPIVGQKVESSADRGSLGTSRDRVRLDNTNGTGFCEALDYPATGLCQIRWP